MGWLVRKVIKDRFISNLDDRTVITIQRRLRSGFPMDRDPFFNNAVCVGDKYVNCTQDNGRIPAVTLRMSNPLILANDEVSEQIVGRYDDQNEATEAIRNAGFDGVAIVNLDNGELNVVKIKNANGKPCGE